MRGLRRDAGQASDPSTIAREVIHPGTGERVAIEYAIDEEWHFVAADQEARPGLRIGEFPPLWSGTEIISWSRREFRSDATVPPKPFIQPRPSKLAAPGNEPDAGTSGGNGVGDSATVTEKDERDPRLLVTCRALEQGAPEEAPGWWASLRSRLSVEDKVSLVSWSEHEFTLRFTRDGMWVEVPVSMAAAESKNPRVSRDLADTVRHGFEAARETKAVANED